MSIIASTVQHGEVSFTIKQFLSNLSPLTIKAHIILDVNANICFEDVTLNLLWGIFGCLSEVSHKTSAPESMVCPS